MQFTMTQNVPEALVTIPEGATTEQAAQAFMGAIAEADALYARLRADFEKMASELTVYQEMNEAASKAATLRASAREFFESQPAGVVTTGNGKLGMQERRTLTFTPASVRQLAPEIAGLVIAESVDGPALKKIVPTLIKSGKARADLLTLLEERAEVKTTYAFVCQVAEPEQPKAIPAAQDPATEAAPF